MIQSVDKLICTPTEPEQKPNSQSSDEKVWRRLYQQFTSDIVEPIEPAEGEQKQFGSGV